MTGTRRDVLRLGVAAAALFAAGPLRAQQQQGFISRKLNAPVPGGVAVLALGDGPAAPEVTFLERRALVVREEGRQWIAVVGIPCRSRRASSVCPSTTPGRARTAFTVRPKEYAAQHHAEEPAPGQSQRRGHEAHRA